jgi:hypothetical protein
LIYRKALAPHFSFTDTMKNSEQGPGWFSALLRVLAKLGILRYGAKSYTYTSGRDRPPESLMNDVFNAERDLTTAQDVKTLSGRTGRSENPENDAAVPPPGPRAVHDTTGRRK